MFEVILSNGDRAEQETEDGILFAARMLVADSATSYGATRMLRRDAIVIRDGMYDGRLTTRARRGE